MRCVVAASSRRERGARRYEYLVPGKKGVEDAKQG